MDETQKRIDALLERVRKTLPMDPWTYGRVRGPLEELVEKWKGVSIHDVDIDACYLCARDLEELLAQWVKEADQVGEQMERELHAGHAADDHEADDEEDDLEL